MSSNQGDGEIVSPKVTESSIRAEESSLEPYEGRGTTVDRPAFPHTPSDPLDDYKAIDLEELRKREGKVIQQRRKKAWEGALPPLGSQDDESKETPYDLVGLALSGGGVRSSTFNTGVLQGLQEIGLLKHVDYLATVSGGGFIGGFLTSQYQKHKYKQVYEDRFPLKRENNGGQNAEVNQLTRSGDYLKNPIELSLRVAFGVVLHLLIIASILILSCSAISWLWRLPDIAPIQRRLAQGTMLLDRSPLLGAILFTLIVSWLCLAYYWPRARWNWPKSASIFILIPCGFFVAYRLPPPVPGSTLVLVILGSRLLLIGVFLYFITLLNENLMKQAAVVGSLGRRLAKQTILVGMLLLFIAYEGGFFAVYRDWFALSDIVRALIPFVGLVYLFGMLGQARKDTEKNKAEEDNKPKGEDEAGKDNKTKGESKNQGILGLPFLMLVGPPLLLTTCLSVYASWGNSHVWSDVLVFLLAWLLFIGVAVLLFNADPSEFLKRVRRYKNPVLVVGFLFTILTLLANGDTDVGPRIGQVLRRLLPGLGQEVDAAAGQVSLQMRNDASFRQWISTVTQYLVFIQLISGVIPLLLPRQFASSGQSDAGGFSRSVYRGIIFLLFVSLPLVICFLFLRENLSGAVQIPSPIKRLAVSRDPITGMYGYLIDHDQWTRFRWFIAGLAGFLALNWFVDLNRTSLHRYYRDRLKEAYFSTFPDSGRDPDEDELKETKLVEINVKETGAPYPLLVATLNEARPGSISVDSGCAFIFTPLYCGWSRNLPIGPLTSTAQKTEAPEPSGSKHSSCFIKTEAYPGLRLVDAMAISGAAITPSSSHSILDTVILMAANARLGQWLVNPQVGTQNGESSNDEKALEERKDVFEKLLGKRGHGIPSVSTWRLMTSLLKSPTGGREVCFVSDGAHYDNLGMETLFERRCRLIIASDASHDSRYEFGDLTKTLRRLRAFKGIEFFLNRKSAEDYLNKKMSEDGECEAAKVFVSSLPDEMLAPKDFLRSGRGGSKKSAVKDFVTSAGDASKKNDEPPCCQSHHLVFAFRYPKAMVAEASQRWGLLIVLKPSLKGDEDRQTAGLYSFARSQKTFPMDGDMNQFFDENQCEYYRELGAIVAASIIEGKETIGSPESLDGIMKSIVEPRVNDQEPAGAQINLILVSGAHPAEVPNGEKG